MKNYTQKGIVLTFIMILVMACQPKEKEVITTTTEALDVEKIKSEIQAMETAFAESYNNGTANGKGYYAPDAASYSQNKPPLIGADVIAVYIKEEMESLPKGAKISFSVTEIFPSTDGKQVVELGRYDVNDADGLSLHRGNFMSLFVLKDGKYVCIRDMGASEKPLEEK